jgi:3-isopropylmalate/(R)-2-methylmalate dehydratase large subunit
MGFEDDVMIGNLLILFSLVVAQMDVSKILEHLPKLKGRKKAANVTAWLVPGSHVVEAQIKKKVYSMF